MQELSGFPYVEAQFDPLGALSPQGQETEVLDTVREAQLTDIVVFAHGWNNNMGEARDLYVGIFAHVRTVFEEAPLSGDRRLGVLGILWPSKKFTDRELIPGSGAASLGDGRNESGDVSIAYLEKEIDRLNEVATPGAPDLSEAKSLLDRLEDDPVARERFVELVRASLDAPEPAPISGEPEPEASRSALDADPEELFATLSTPLIDLPNQSGLGGAADIGDRPSSGGAASIGSIFASAKAAAERLLNFGTYYQMKERAGRIGSSGAADLLRALRRGFAGLRIHLVGHSFGARLVTAAADACGMEVRPTSLLLLQGAFSHNGFAPTFQADGRSYTGFFRGIIQSRKIVGPIVVTHTANDKAVGLVYALASRLAREAAAGLGDEGDLYGGLGRNGAVRMPDTELGGQSLNLLAPGGEYGFNAGRIFNLRADNFIDGHSGIRNDAVAYALLKVIA